MITCTCTLLWPTRVITHYTSTATHVIYHPISSLASSIIMYHVIYHPISRLASSIIMYHVIYHPISRLASSIMMYHVIYHPMSRLAYTVQITFIFIGQTHLVFGKRVCTCVTKHSNAFRTFLNWLKNSKRVWHEPKLHILRLPFLSNFDL